MMKRLLKILFVFLLCFMIVPVKADATAIKAYFMVYPDGSEVGTLNSNEANNPSEKLIYTGTTDQNGEIALCDWAEEGELRIVQHVPEGYTTNTRDIKMDLSKESTVKFIDYRGLVNPSTGRSILFVLGIIGLSMITVVIVKGKKKAYMMIPIIIGATFMVHTRAFITCKTIVVQDGSGNPLSGVTVDVYAKPIYSEESYYVIFDANGGNFFDGSTTMMYRLPSPSCSGEEFTQSLSDDDYSRLYYNYSLAYRDGYVIQNTVLPTYYVSGDVINVPWVSSDDMVLVEIKGNGGTVDFYGKRMDSIIVDVGHDFISRFMDLFERDEFYNIGLDTTPSCSNFSDDGTGLGIAVDLEQLSEGGGAIDFPDVTRREDGTIPTFYVCWNDRPDGIYVNGEVLMRGTPDTCFEEAYADYFDGGAQFYGITHSAGNIVLSNKMYVYYEGQRQFYFTSIYEPSFASTMPPSAFQLEGLSASEPVISYTEVYKDLETLEIVRNGQTILTITPSDLSVDSVPNTNDYQNKKLYRVTNQNKLQKFNDYFHELFSSCPLSAHE